MRTMKNLVRLTVLATAVLTFGACSNEIVSDAAPVELVVTNSQNLMNIDVLGGAGCGENIGTINMTVIPKAGHSGAGDFDQVRVETYRVSYRRTDGGTLVPSSFVRPIDVLIAVGGSADDSLFQIFESDVFTRAPFAALFPQNGGVDPETGRRVVSLPVIVEVFGETLGGDDVYDSTSFPLEFCFDCGGCA